MPGAHVVVVQQRWTLSDHLAEGARQPVPVGEVTCREKPPAQLVQRPVGLGAVPELAGGDQVVVLIIAALGDGHDMVDGRAQVPVRWVRGRHLPVRRTSVNVGRVVLSGYKRGNWAGGKC